MDDPRQLLDAAYKAALDQKASATQLLREHVDVLVREEPLSLLESLRKTGDGDPPNLRLAHREALGDIFQDLTQGQLSVFRELALEAYESALSINKRNAALLLKCGVAWYQRVHGDREHNLSRAIQRAEDCLEKTTVGATRQRGLANNLLGLALTDLQPFIGADSFEEAKACFGEALRVFQQLKETALVAMVHLNTGNLCAAAGDAVSAISQYRSALESYSQLSNTDDIALAERNLGATLLDLTDPHSRAAIEEALDLLQDSLTRVPRTRDPHTFAVTLNNMGRAYALRSAGQQEGNFEAARSAFENAGMIFLELGEITRARVAYTSAGGISYELKQWLVSLRYFQQALDLLEREWDQKLTTQGRLQLDRDSARIFDFAVLSAIRLGDPVEAIRLVEHARHRVLLNAYYSRLTHAMPGSSPELWQQSEALRRKRTDLQQQLTVHRQRNSFRNSEPAKEWARNIEELRLQEEKLRRAINVSNPGFLPMTSPLEPEIVAGLAQQLDAYICAVKPTLKGTIIFTALPDGTVCSSVLEEATVSYWRNLLFGGAGWITAYKQFRNGHLFSRHRWIAAMDETLSEVFQTLIGPCLSLMSLPVSQRVNDSVVRKPRLYFLAGGVLDLLPLHAAFVDSGSERRYLIDVANVGYFSSFRLLEQAIRRGSQIGPARKLVILRGPQQKLPFMQWECTFATKTFPGDTLEYLLDGGEPVDADWQLASCGSSPSMFLLSCHAFARQDDALRSGLYWSARADGTADLTLADLLGMDLPHSALVLLSACETSLSEVDNPCDECLSLANAFLAIGAVAAIGTQWAANDVASALWTARFFLNIHNCSNDYLDAANEASRWIRDSSLDDKVQLLKSCPAALPEGFERSLEKDFNHPFFWANHKFYGPSFPKASQE
jgi:tetratricopeptide (TPR) repeat protein